MNQRKLMFMRVQTHENIAPNVSVENIEDQHVTIANDLDAVSGVVLQTELVQEPVEPEPDFEGPMNEEHKDLWNTWWHKCQSSHNTYRLQGFKHGDRAGYFRNIRNGTQFRVEWFGQVPLHKAVYLQCVLQETHEEQKKVYGCVDIAAIRGAN
jgi:hypothetical protein